MLGLYQEIYKNSLVEKNGAYIIKISGLFLDTLKSTYENITFDEIIEKINNKLDTLQDSLLDASQDNNLDDDKLSLKQLN